MASLTILGVTVFLYALGSFIKLTDASGFRLGIAMIFYDFINELSKGEPLGLLVVLLRDPRNLGEPCLFLN